MVESFLCYTRALHVASMYAFSFKAVREIGRGVDLGKDPRRENAPERDRLDERGRGRPEDRDVLFLVTRFSFLSFHWTGMFITPDFHLKISF